jgi:branched-chain amino acid transport system substrate-binding protein
MNRLACHVLALTTLAAPTLAAEDLTVGFAIAKSGWMEAYDTPAATAAMIRIEEINAAGGLLGRQIKVVEADTRTDRAESAKAGLDVLDQGAEMMVVSCDYDFPVRRGCEGGYSGCRPEQFLILGPGPGSGRDHG